MSGASGRNCFDKRDEELKQRDEELERLHRLVKDLELEARGRRWRWDHEERGEGLASVGGHRGVGSHQSGSHCHQDLSWGAGGFECWGRQWVCLCSYQVVSKRWSEGYFCTSKNGCRVCESLLATC